MEIRQLYFKEPADWRKWLEVNHLKDITVWLVFYKKASGKPAMKYEDALDEALCFGWIDSIIKNIDNEKYVRKFTRRKEDSKWSELNKKRTEILIKGKRMTPYGMSKINYAKKNGQWYKDNRLRISFDIPAEFEAALNKDRKAKINFENLAPTYRKQYIGWITTAKLEGTKRKRINESIKLLSRGEKLGLR